jgi:hypothetical protein
MVCSLVTALCRSSSVNQASVEVTLADIQQRLKAQEALQEAQDELDRQAGLRLSAVVVATVQSLNF